MDLTDRIAALVPPLNSLRREAVTEMAHSIAVQAPSPPQVQAESASSDAGAGALGANNAPPTQIEPAQPRQPVQSKRSAHYLWAALIARIYEVFP